MKKKSFLFLFLFLLLLSSIIFTLFFPKKIQGQSCIPAGQPCTNDPTGCCTGLICSKFGPSYICSSNTSLEPHPYDPNAPCIPANQSCALRPDGCCSGLICSKVGPSFICSSNSSLAPHPNLNPDLDNIFCDSSNKPTSAPNPNNPRIYTAIGCIPVTGTQEFTAWILRWAIGVGGGIALLLIIVASFQIITSSGNPEKVQAGKELLTSAIAGLIMLIFSVFILKVIGVDILKLPGLK